MSKLRIFFASMGFSLGFGIMFFLISIPFIGISSIQSLKAFISIVGGAILVLVGLILLDVLKIPFLNRYFKIFNYNVSSVSTSNLITIFLGSIFVGLSFSSGWAPCVGPVMLGILSLLSNQQNMLSAIIMLLFMTIGLMSGFIITSFIVVIFGNVIGKLSKFSIFMERVMGIVFIILGIIIMLSKTNLILSLGIGANFLEEFNYQITNFSLFTVFISFIAGIFLFLSPCTLPLVIPYLFYLTGIGVSKK
ncbi:MAG: cytochrome c biogenesis protein CcdA [Candidatus Calescibacterium sp.]|nr:cytochrome c biogenesis protein CcdA [Candidatus Calescibacterium sp.]MDW8132692.1 cytochrome c biogenesis protein CcdA [Candidatus Calescibacterium sp.]